MEKQQKQTLWQFLLNLLKMVFSVGEKHVEKKIYENDHEGDI